MSQALLRFEDTRHTPDVLTYLQVHAMLSAVQGAAPEGVELEAFLGKPCNHMARLIRDLCAPEAVQENLKNVLAFIKNVSLFLASNVSMFHYHIRGFAPSRVSLFPACLALLWPDHRCFGLSLIHLLWKCGANTACLAHPETFLQCSLS